MMLARPSGHWDALFSLKLGLQGSSVGCFQGVLAGQPRNSPIIWKSISSPSTTATITAGTGGIPHQNCIRSARTLMSMAFSARMDQPH